MEDKPYYIACNDAIKLIEREMKMEILLMEEKILLSRHLDHCLGCCNYYKERLGLK